MEGKERMKRKRNIIIKGVKVGSGTGEEEVKNLMRDIGAQVRVEEVRKLAGKKEGKGSILLVKIGSEQERKEVLEKKRLKGREERIEKDLTWREKERRWLIEQRSWEEKKKGSVVWVGRDRLWINGELWCWDEDLDELREGGRSQERSGKEGEFTKAVTE